MHTSMRWSNGTAAIATPSNASWIGWRSAPRRASADGDARHRVEAFFLAPGSIWRLMTSPMYEFRVAQAPTDDSDYLGRTRGEWTVSVNDKEVHTGTCRATAIAELHRQLDADKTPISNRRVVLQFVKHCYGN